VRTTDPAPAHRDDTSAEPDAALIAASVHDAERFATLFVRHGSAVHRYLARRLGSDLADDCTAEVFVAAFRHRARYKPATATALPWLFGIASRVVAQWRREESNRWRLLAALPPDAEQVSDESETDDRLAAQALRTVLVEAIRALPAVERELLLLVAWEHLTPTEAAEALGIPPATARTRLHRARSRVRKHLAGGAGADQSFHLEELFGHE
jgi:RNA polymerase sigma factor (sigma-70 family)